MPTYLVKKTGARSADYIVLRKGAKYGRELINKWKKKGYQIVTAPTQHKAIEKVTGVKLGKTIR